MTETEQKLIDDLRPRLDNWRRAYRDRVVKNVSIAYGTELIEEQGHHYRYCVTN